jgi:hypothetical protein
MWITGISVEVVHCPHCTPRVWWLENERGKAPELAFSQFPSAGAIVLSKNHVIVACKACMGQIDLMKLDTIRPSDSLAT